MIPAERTTPSVDSGSIMKTVASEATSFFTPVYGLITLSPFTSWSYCRALYSQEQMFRRPSIESTSAFTERPVRSGSSKCFGSQTALR